MAIKQRGAVEHSHAYLNQEYSAMRWLAKQGLSPEEIREFGWGSVDEESKAIKLRRKFVHVKYDIATGAGKQDEEIKEITISLKGTGHEYFFLKSKTPSYFWVFTAYAPGPKDWRREDSKKALFPLEVVKWACRGIEDCGKQGDISTLTKMEKFGNIEITKLNIANLERIKEASTTAEAKK